LFLTTIILLTFTSTLHYAKAADYEWFFPSTNAWKLTGYNTYVEFSSGVYCDAVGYDSYPSNTAWYFKNVYMDGETVEGWFRIGCQNGNVTVTSLLVDKKVKLTIDGNPGIITTTTLSFENYGEPVSVEGATSWAYSASTNTLILTVLHASPADIIITCITPSVPVTPTYTWNPFDLMNTYLKNKNFVGFIVAIYSSTLGELFYGMLILIITLPIYLRTQSLIYCAIVWLVLGSFFAAILPVSASHVAYFFIAISLTSILYKLLTREKD